MFAAWWGWGSLILAGAAVAGCSVTTDEQPHPGTCGALQLLGVEPAQDARDVPPDVTLTLHLSDFPEPDTISQSTVTLYTGFYYHTGRFWVDLVDRRVLFKPTGQLTAGLGYTLVVRPKIRSLRGCQLEQPPPVPGGDRPDSYAFFFEVGTTQSPPAPPAATHDQVMDVFARHCAGGGCHLDTSEGRAASDPAACLPEEDAGGRLSLCASEARDNLVGVPSRQVARLVRVAARDSGRSYLLRKVIGAPPVVGHLGVPNDTLTSDELRILQSWIDTGAQPQPPPDPQ